jgi:chromosome segregation ATPase
MSQSTLDEDELFGEAASEVREDVEASLRQASDSLPDTDDIWNVEADNTLGALNALRSALDTGDAADHLRDAKKWYTMGERADAFEDADDLEAEIGRVEEAIEDIEDAKSQVGDLTSTIPGLKNTLEDLQHAAEESGERADETDERADETDDEADADEDAEEADEAQADDEDAEAEAAE